MCVCLCALNQAFAHCHLCEAIVSCAYVCVHESAHEHCHLREAMHSCAYVCHILNVIGARPCFYARMYVHESFVLLWSSVQGNACICVCMCICTVICARGCMCVHESGTWSRSFVQTMLSCPYECVHESGICTVVDAGLRVYVHESFLMLWSFVQCERCFYVRMCVNELGAWSWSSVQGVAFMCVCVCVCA
jgi:hypothetical protein